MTSHHRAPRSSEPHADSLRLPTPHNGSPAPGPAGVMSAWIHSPRQLQQRQQIAQLRSTTPTASGLPTGLRQGIESISGLDMSGVRVHRNSSKPAALQAHAYAQGQDIHLGPGQDEHLPHEAWHVVQQAQGRVRPTTKLGGVAVNDDPAHEREADLMGRQALQQQRATAAAKARPGTMTPVLQGRFDIELLFDDPAKRERLFAAGYSLDDLEEVQELLESKDDVNRFLAELEASMSDWFKQREHSHYKYTRALDLALWEQEKRWMVPKGEGVRSEGSRETIPADIGQESSTDFLGRIRGAKPLKDVGAAVSHGEYAHRIQWYVISRSAMEIGSVTPAWLQGFYAILGAQEFETQVATISADILKNTWSLWNALVDVPGTVADDYPKETPPSGVGAVGFSAPVHLTGHISRGEGGLPYSQLRLAVLNRRIKRYFEADAGNPKRSDKGRYDAELAKMLGALPLTMKEAGCKGPQVEEALSLLRAAGGDYANNARHLPYAYDYDQRNTLAFALCGIPTQD